MMGLFEGWRSAVSEGFQTDPKGDLEESLARSDLHTRPSF